jgi:hypothetical protein
MANGAQVISLMEYRVSKQLAKRGVRGHRPLVIGGKEIFLNPTGGLAIRGCNTTGGDGGCSR